MKILILELKTKVLESFFVLIFANKTNAVAKKNNRTCHQTQSKNNGY